MVSIDKPTIRIAPCLFCFHRKKPGKVRTGFGFGTGFYMYCTCRCCGPTRSTANGAAKAWNQVWKNAERAIHPPQ